MEHIFLYPYKFKLFHFIHYNKKSRLMTQYFSILINFIALKITNASNFPEFVLGLAQIAVRDQARDKKLSFIFRIYDMDRDGYISNGELFQVLKMMTGKNLTDAQLQQIVDKTILYLDKDADGKISFEEFKQVVEERGTESDITKMLSVDAAKI